MDGLLRAIVHKTGPQLRPCIRKRSGACGGGGIVQGAEQLLCDEWLRCEFRFKPGGKSIHCHLQLIAAPCPQVQHDIRRQLGGGAFRLRQGKAHRLCHAQAVAILGDALKIYHLLEGQCRRLTLQSSVPFCPPCTLHPQFPLDNSFTGKQLYLCHTGVTGNIQYSRGGLCEDKFSL